jgi:hypothetical protein
VPDLLGKALERRARGRDRPEQLGVAVPGDDLGRGILDAQAEAIAHVRLDVG